jgi:hypothetical protein
VLKTFTDSKDFISKTVQPETCPDPVQKKASDLWSAFLNMLSDTLKKS